MFKEFLFLSISVVSLIIWRDHWKLWQLWWMVSTQLHLTSSPHQHGTTVSFLILSCSFAYFRVFHTSVANSEINSHHGLFQTLYWYWIFPKFTITVASLIPPAKLYFLSEYSVLPRLHPVIGLWTINILLFYRKRAFEMKNVNINCSLSWECALFAHSFVNLGCPLEHNFSEK